MARKKSSQQGKSKSKKNSKKKGAEAGEDACGGAQSAPRRGNAHPGPVPNLFWGAVSATELRARSRFIPLPPATAVLPLSSPAAARFLRQETDAWRALHTGILTTGQLKEALGLREAAAARVVGGRKDSSHQPLIAAVKSLQLPPALPRPAGPAEDLVCRRRALEGLCSQLQLPGGGQDPFTTERGNDAAASGGGGSDDGPLSQEDQYRRSAAALSSGGLMGVRCAWGKAQEAAALAALLHVFPCSTLHEVGMCCVAEADAPPGLFPLAASPDAIIAHHLLLPQQQVQQLQRSMQLQQQAAANSAACAAAAAASAGGKQEDSTTAAAAAAVLAFRQQTQRMRWQLRELMELVPMARPAGEEVEQEYEQAAPDAQEAAHEGQAVAEQQAASGTDSEDDEEEENAKAGDGETEGPVDARGEVLLDGDSGDGGASSEDGEEVSLTEASTDLLGSGVGRTGMVEPGMEAESRGCYGGQDSSGLGRDDSLAAAALHQLEVLTRVLGRALAAAAGAAAAATGTAAPAPEPSIHTRNYSTSGSDGAASGEDEGPHAALLAAVLESRLPLVVLCGECSGRCSEKGHEPCSAAPEVLQATEAPAAASEAEMRPHLCCCSANRGCSISRTDGESTCSAAAAAAERAACGADEQSSFGGLQHVVLREVVEVKSTCPFGMRQVRRGGKGRVHTEVVLSDPGPRHAVPAAWVPQLQLHMLAAGCQSALVVSRSASKGMTVFRLLRDDDYLQRMMSVLTRLNNEYVRRGLTPPPDMFARQPDYCAFLGITARLARHATPLYPSRGVWRPPAEEALNRDDAFIRRPVEPVDC